jgi:hypothetical protein
MQQIHKQIENSRWSIQYHVTNSQTIWELEVMNTISCNKSQTIWSIRVKKWKKTISCNKFTNNLKNLRWSIQYHVTNSQTIWSIRVKVKENISCNKFTNNLKNLRWSIQYHVTNSQTIWELEVMVTIYHVTIWRIWGD